MTEFSPELFSSKDRALVMMPAGCGKTRLIAEAVACLDEGSQLILTHTHAGVKALRDRLRVFRVSSSRYRIDTIAGFALKYAASFPESSGLGLFDPKEQDWERVYDAATQILSSRVAEKIICLSYSGMYVDEYQDCNLRQHELIMKLAGMLPCRIVGDPLQGIFDFGTNQLVDWNRDVFPNFERLPAPEIPWRWSNTNKGLGKWLLDVRENLLNGQPICLRRVPKGVKWMQFNPKNQIGACKSLLGNKDDSIIAIHRWPKEAHATARQLGGRFTSMEEVACEDLIKWSKKLEQLTGRKRAVATIDFGSVCMTGINTKLGRIRKKLETPGKRTTRKLKFEEIYLALNGVADSDDLSLVLEAILLMEEIKGCSLYRRELWYDMQRSLREYGREEYNSLADAAWHVRDRGRIWGRRVSRRTVSRTLLVKGLEFDHAVVLNADGLDVKNLYVAMTRASKSLIVISSNPIIKKGSSS